MADPDVGSAVAASHGPSGTGLAAAKNLSQVGNEQNLRQGSPPDR